MLIFIKRHKLILLVLFVLLCERLMALDYYNASYNLASDDLSYVNAGITFAHTGQITMHGVLSAQIMPAMPVIIGIMSLVLGEGTILWLALKLLWCCMGVMSAFYIYKSVILFAPRWCGLLAATCLLSPEFVWMDNVILTETPFMLMFTLMIYNTLKMGKTQKPIYFWGCLAAYMAGLMLKANIAIFPVFALVYLLAVKYDRKKLLQQCLILAAAVFVFVVPWSVRNYVHFKAFIPLTYGSGNPALLGTYQGEGYPPDEALDYKTNVDDIAQEKFAEYYNSDGSIKPYLQRYASLERDGIKASYRQSEWRRTDPKSMLLSYLYLKPKIMLTGVYYDDPLPRLSKDRVAFVRKTEYAVFCLLLLSTLLLSLIKRNKKQAGGTVCALLFLAALYYVNIYIYAFNFAYERYSQTLMPACFISIGLGLGLTARIKLILNGK